MEKTRQPSIAPLVVADAMHVGVIACGRETPLADAAATMARERVHCVVVESGAEEHAAWGVVSDLDLVAASLVRGLEDQTVGGSASTPVVTVSPAETLERAAQLMTEHAVSHLIVVGRDREPVGVLSTLDLAANLAKEKSS